MVLRAALLTIAALAAAAAPARAQDMFTTFQTLCVANPGDDAHTLAAADAAGWMMVPQSLLDKLASNPVFGNTAQARLHSDKDVALILMTMNSSIPQVVGVRGNMCAVVAAGTTTPPDIAKAAADFAGVPAHMVKEDTIYMWRDANDAHVAVDPQDASFKDLAGRGEVKFMAVRQDDKMSMILFGVTAKSS